MPKKSALAVVLSLVAATALAEPEAPLTPEQMEIAAKVFLGDASCDLQQRVQVHAVEGRPGWFEVRHLKTRYLLAPQLTQTGAVRLEDRRTGMVWLQIPAKSMLLDTAKGSRLLDGCSTAEQRTALQGAAAADAQAGGGFGIAATGR